MTSSGVDESAALLNRIARLRGRIERLDAQAIAARKQLAVAVAEARERGYSMEVIGSTAGLSRQRVNQLLRKADSIVIEVTEPLFDLDDE